MRAIQGLADVHAEAGVLATGARIRVVSDSYTRPNTTTQYTAGDQVADSESAPTVLTFEAGLVNGGVGAVYSAVIVDSAAQATKPNLRLYLFDESVTANNDNAAWAPSDATLGKVIGYAEFTSWEVGTPTAGADGNCFSVGTLYPDAVPFACASDSKNIYGLLVERGTYTPIAQEVFTVNLTVI